MSLALDDRQRAMLAEMGVKVWAPRHQVASEFVAESPTTTKADAQKQAEVAIARAASAPARPAVAPAPVTAREPSAVPLAPAEGLGPRPAGIEAMDWAELQSTVAACRACGLCAGRTQTVFDVGSRSADWMVVGEAPGENEDRLGQPFVGQAGKLLDQMLAAIGLSRQVGDTTNSIAEDATPTKANGLESVSSGPGKQGVYIANVLKCRPPANRNPLPEEVAQCEPYLRRQVALVQPRIILAMGRFAVQSLLGTQEPIGRLRGRVHQYEGVPVIVTYHPAYLLRALPEKAKAWQDLCLAMKVARGG